jgi:hypothetical protein
MTVELVSRDIYDPTIHFDPVMPQMPLACNEMASNEIGGETLVNELLS